MARRQMPGGQVDSISPGDAGRRRTLEGSPIDSARDRLLTPDLAQICLPKASSTVC
jgi:hypothetical protein